MNKNPHLPLIGGLVALVVVLLIIAVSSYRQYQMLAQETGVSGKKELEQIIKKINHFMVLPNEEPTLATVTDTSRLEGQLFFSKAKNGDKVLVFTNSKKAILYRPSENKVIEVGVLTYQTGSGSPTPRPTTAAKKTSSSLKVVILNGSTTAGLANLLAQTIDDKKLPVEIIDTDNAVKNDYSQSIIVDLSGGKKSAEVKDIAEKLSLQVIKNFPEGEIKPASAEALIIVGS